jgi:phosphoglycerate dehydrogenase-like enzyme
MKLLLHYDAGPILHSMLAELPEGMSAAIVTPGDDSALRRELADTDILLHVLAPVTADMIDAAPNLKLIQKVGTGVDAIDRGHAAARGVAVCNMPGTNTAAVAEMTLALMLACLRRVVTLNAAMADGTAWSLARGLGEGMGEIGGSVVGLVGYGAVPRKLIPVLHTLGAKVLVANRSRHNDDVEFVELDELLSRSDIVSLHLPSVPETIGLIDARRLAIMKSEAIVINTARGNLVDESALADALKNDRLAGAGLDVFGSEPTTSGNPLVQLKNVVCTPHVAWLTRQTLRRSISAATDNILRLQEGRPLVFTID